MKFPFLIMTKEYQFPPITNIIQNYFFLGSIFAEGHS